MPTASFVKGWFLGTLLCFTIVGAVAAGTDFCAQEPLVETHVPNVRAFMVPGGTLDAAALRASGYEGPLDFSGFGVDLDAGKSGPVLTTLAGSGRRAPGDENWFDGFGHPDPLTGTDRPVYCLALYDGDLIAGGAFTTAGGVPANCIARWDGQAWHAMGRGFPGGRVLAMTVYNGELIAAGEWVAWGLRHVARWNGSMWQSLGDGLENGADSDVAALAIYNGNLIIGGWFSHVGKGIPASRVAGWNGTDWFPLGRGVAVVQGEWSNVYCLAVYGDRLIAGGDFVQMDDVATSRIAAWDGASWSALGAGLQGNDPFSIQMPTMVRALTIYHDKLIAGGWFVKAGDAAASCIASWDGTSWAPIGSGANNLVRSLAVYSGDLYAGGWFSRAGGNPANFIAKWNGADWSPLRSGMDDWVHDALIVRDDVLIVGGWFMEADTVGVGHVARWDGSAWSALEQAPPGNGLDGNVYATVSMGGDLIVAGGFTRVDGVHASNIARWDGAAWSPFGSGMNRAVRAVCLYGGDLVAGGEFTKADGNPAWFIARWNGAGWVPLGAGFDGPVHALAEYGTDLIAGGDFMLADGSVARHVARWDGAHWHPLGEGITSTDPFLHPDVLALHVQDGALYVGGDFNLAGGNAASFIARWDGSAWSGLDNGVSFTVRTLTSHNGDLIAGGEFWYANGGNAYGVARWDGSSWSSIDPTMFDHVYALASYNGLLAIGFGAITSDDRIAYVAFWDGLSWEPVGSGTDGPVRTFTVLGTHLYMGGDFSAAGGNASYHLARWTDPTATQEPPDAVSGPDETGSRTPDDTAQTGGRGPGSGGNPVGSETTLSPLFDSGVTLEVPNPYRPNESIRVDPPSLVPMEVAVFNAEGRRVTTLYSGVASGAPQLLYWDGRTEAGPAPSGIYFVWAKAAGATAHRTVVLWR